MNKVDRLTKRTIPSALYALVSSILSSLFYGFLSDSEKVITKVGSTYVVSDVNKFSPFVSFGITIVLFISVWLILIFGIPFIVSLYDRFRFRTVHKFSRQEFITEYSKARNDIIDVYSQLHPNNFDSEYYIQVIFKKLFTSVNSLYNLFNPVSKKEFHRVNSWLRSGNILDDVGCAVSKYDLIAVIYLAEESISKNKSNEQTLFNKDCREARERLDELIRKYNE